MCGHGASAQTKTSGTINLKNGFLVRNLKFFGLENFPLEKFGSFFSDRTVRVRVRDSIQSGLYALSGIRLKFNVFKFNI